MEDQGSEEEEGHVEGDEEEDEEEAEERRQEMSRWCGCVDRRNSRDVRYL